MTTAHRERLQTIRQRTHSAREARARAREAADAARAAGDTDAQAIASLALEAANIEVETSERLENMLLSSMAGMNGGNGNGHGFGGGIFDDPGTVETLERLGNGSFPIGAIDLGPVSTRDEFVQRINSGAWGQPKLAAGTGDTSVPDSARLGTYYGVTPQLRRPLSLLDIIPSSGMDGRSFGYMREEGALDDAAEAAEGAVKPATDVLLTEAEVVAATIAVWTKLLRQQLADTPSLQQTVNSRLVYQCLRRLENQIVGGDGVGENILGIMNTPGLGSVVFDAGFGAERPHPRWHRRHHRRRRCARMRSCSTPTTGPRC